MWVQGPLEHSSCLPASPCHLELCKEDPLVCAKLLDTALTVSCQLCTHLLGPLDWLSKHVGVEPDVCLYRVCDIHMQTTNIQHHRRDCASPLQAAAAVLQTAGRCEGVSKAYSDCNMSQPRRQRLYQRASISPRSHDVAGQSSPPSSRQIR